MSEEELVFALQPDEIEIFIQDVNEHLQEMESGILEMERTGDVQALNSLFRAAHTLKALAGTVGHQRMADLTHTVENLFDRLRTSGAMPPRSLVDEMLEVVDALKAMREEIVTGQPGGVNAEALEARLQAILAEGNFEVTPVAAPPAAWPILSPEEYSLAESLTRGGQQLIAVEFTVAPDAFAPAARLFQGAMALMEVGTVVSQHPTMDELVEGEETAELRLLLATEQPDEVEPLLADISDLSAWSVTPYIQESPGTPAPAPPAAPVTPAAQNDVDIGTDKTVRISVERLDNLMNLVGELVTNRTRITEIESLLRRQYGKGEGLEQLADMAATFGRVVDQLQEEVIRARMLPISHLFNKFPRIVRDVARAVNKEVELVIEGEATELDRSIIEVIGDPLIHLIRNAIDHGLEAPETRESLGKTRAGLVRLSAALVEGQIVITVADDGRGIDPTALRRLAIARRMISEEEAAALSDGEAMELIFRPSLSTAEKVTEVSGRGVGLDVVRSNVERVGGSVVVDSAPGKGTTFRLALPLTLAIVDTMLVGLGDSTYAIPLSGIIDALYVSSATINRVAGQSTVLWRGSVLPLIDLREFFNLQGGSNQSETLSASGKRAMVTVAWGRIQAGLVVDRIIGKQEVVIKSLSPLLGKVPGMAGGTILGDGRIALIVDIPALINHALLAKKQGIAA